MERQISFSRLLVNKKDRTLAKTRIRHYSVCLTKVKERILSRQQILKTSCEYSQMQKEKIPRPAGFSLFEQNDFSFLKSFLFLYDNFFFHGLQTRRNHSPICLKKSFPLSSTRMKAGKSATWIFQIASIPSSGYSTHSMDLMLFWARIAAGPPIDPR